MKKEEASHLMSLFDYGFLIIIDASPYLDSPVQSIYPSEENDDIVYSSEVFSERSLSEIDVTNVKVYAPAADVWKFNSESIEYDELQKYKDYILDSKDLGSETKNTQLTVMGFDMNSMNFEE